MKFNTHVWRTSSISMALALAACSGSDGSNGSHGTLVNVVAEAAGSNCAAGGTAIQTGPDTNGDGVLSADEVTTTSYVCGDESKDILTDLTEELAGANCEFGGIAVLTGLDDDDNGVLDSSEVDATSYLCEDGINDAVGSVLPGNVVISSPLDLQLLRQFSEIQGDLTLSASAFDGLTAGDLSFLTKVGGVLQVFGTADLLSLDFSNLVEVGGTLYVIDAVNATSIDFSALTSAGSFFCDTSGDAAELLIPLLATLTANSGFFAVAECHLADLDASALTTIPDYLIIGGSTLGTLDLSGLVSINILEIFESTVGDINLTSFASASNTDFQFLASTVGAINLPLLESVRNLIVGDVILSSINLAELVSVSAELQLAALSTITSLSAPKLSALTSGRLRIHDNPSITSISLPSLVSVGSVSAVRELRIQNNTALQTLSLPLLTTVEGEVLISDNTSLPCAQVDPIRIAIDGASTPTNWDLSNNAADCVEP